MLLENFSRFWRIEITFQKSLYIDNQCFLYFSKKFLENFSRFWRIEIVKTNVPISLLTN